MENPTATVHSNKSVQRNAERKYHLLANQFPSPLCPFAFRFFFSFFFYLLTIILCPATLFTLSSLSLGSDAAQLYQQYSEEAQNIEILRQSHFTVVPVHAERPAGPLPSGPPTSAPPAPPSAPASRPLPPLPLVPHPHSLSSSLSSSRSSGSAKNLPLPETPKAEPRPPSPPLSISLGQSTSLWQDLPGVRNSTDLGQLSEDQRRLQEVREVET